MKIDIRNMLSDLMKKRPAAAKKGGKTGYSVALKDGEHETALYSRDRERVLLSDVRTVSTRELKAISRRAKPLSVCFYPQSIYADLGDFSSVSHEATLAHIRSTIDKTGLFNGQYSVSCRKVYDIDSVRARFSYLAIPASEIEKIRVLDEGEVFLDTFRPVEASIASLVGKVSGDMAVSVFEDELFLRIIGSKDGVIHHLAAINKPKAFDLMAETLAGISETVSVMKNTYNENPEAVYKVGPGEISAEELRENGIDARDLELEGLLFDASYPVELLGNTCSCSYDFAPKAYRDTVRLARLASYSLIVSLIMAAVSGVLFFLGFQSSSQARDYDRKFESARQEYAWDMASLEQEYAANLKDLDMTRINELIALYRDFTSEPRLHAILGAVTQAVPEGMTLQRVDVRRPGLAQDPTQETHGLAEQQTSPEDLSQDPSDQAAGALFHIRIEGTVRAPYPASKSLFSDFLLGVQKHYPVLKASFTHAETQALCTVECEARK